MAIHPTPLKFDTMVKKLWDSKTCQAYLRETTKVLWLYDGKRLAWAPKDIGEKRIPIDLDNDGVNNEDRKPPKIGKDGKPRNNTFTLILRKTTGINLSILPAYLQGQIGWCEPLLEAMSKSCFF